jgi:glycerophosphoryl diester phosphodiesterase
MNSQDMSDLELFLTKVRPALKHPQERKRAEALLAHWAAQWAGPRRNITFSFSNHGAFLHFHQLIGTTWSAVFSFHAANRQGLSMRGPDTDRTRKAHKLRANPMDRSGLDAVYEAWSAHPEGRPAGNAVEFFLEETSDDTWEACLQEVLRCLS